ncbi:hypothetical protein Nepgr_026359 [Nepenthes gracilis]|uniref:Uncharacterized protein n=1 Tax=Nepenthes gracilis TaxID=150966 RepID=A0AAD3T9I4_NEPGR|nr:hypothetical protein Nepgr_026359 [Nepenthes gracilis]
MHQSAAIALCSSVPVHFHIPSLLLPFQLAILRLLVHIHMLRHGQANTGMIYQRTETSIFWLLRQYIKSVYLQNRFAC